MAIRRPLRSSWLPSLLACVAMVFSSGGATAHQKNDIPRSAAALVESGGRVVRFGADRKAGDQVASTPRASTAGIRRQPSGAATPRSPKAVDPVTVTAHKVCVGQDCTVELAWAGASGPVTVVSASEATFQHGVTTLEMNFSGVQLSIAVESFPSDDYFVDVADQNLAGRGVQGIGYDPLPLPRIESMTGGNWWWDPAHPADGEIVVNGAYLDPIAEANVVILPNRAVRASSVTLDANGFADSATFQFPGDARGNYVRLASGGRPANLVGAGALFLHPRGIPAYANNSIRDVVWAPQAGRLWVAAGSVIDEIDLFRRNPVQTTVIGGLTKPCISRVSDTHELVAVDGVLGVAEVKIVDTLTGAVSVFAATSDSEFTRQIRPVGIALARDGSACYVADASLGYGNGRVVKIPRDNGADITDEYGGYTTWAFPDPCGMDTADSGVVYIPDANAVRGITAGGGGTYVDVSISGVKTVLIDREASKDGVNRYFMTTGPTIAECFNKNPIEYGDGTATVPARNLGGLVYGWTNGLLSLESHWFYESQQKTPQKVLLHNALQGEWAYPSPDQVTDRVIELVVEGWHGVPLHLELVDPPDLAPYISKDLDDPAGFSEFPYEAGDNVTEVAGEYGLTLSSDGSGASMTLTVTPGADDLITFYLKVPPNVSGNNYKVKVSKIDQTTGLPLSDRVVSLSPFYTTWKRIYVERDKMFREGGVLASDYLVENCGGPGQDPCCGDPGQLACNQIRTYEWTNVNVGDFIVVFDEWAGVTEFSVFLERLFPIVMVEAVGAPDPDGLRVLTLDEPMERNFRASPWVPASPTDPRHQPVFCNQQGQDCHVSGFGVASGCDLDWNQINSLDSCFYDVDLRGVEQAFGEAFVEILSPRSGSNVMPTLPQAWFSWEAAFEDANPNSAPYPLDHFTWAWFQNAPTGPSNYLQILGVTSLEGALACGSANRLYKRTLLYRRAVELWGGLQDPPATVEQLDNFTQYVTDHEFGHHFRAQECSDGEHHNDVVDPKPAWCAPPWTDPGVCPPDSSSPELCLMNNGNIGMNNAQGWDPVFRFCEECLIQGDPDPDCSGSPRGGAIRTEEDPLQ
ncbi:MAG: hypothetical protein K8R59_05980 [Thermoanaerobaculales bacterium]|nr:hypothetical protein [Thermoanaerobaculales bacterium]